MTYRRLDFLYMPSKDVASDLAFFTDVLGGTVLFAIEAMGTRVAAIELAEHPPTILLADHVEGERPILVYRVDDLSSELEKLRSRGCEIESNIEIPHGPCSTFRTPDGHRLALYELKRPEVADHFRGRRDF